VVGGAVVALIATESLGWCQIRADGAKNERSVRRQHASFFQVNLCFRLSSATLQPFEHRGGRQPSGVLLCIGGDEGGEEVMPT
jgi:hypothetical protein